MKRIYLIDCPGVVPPNANDSEQDILLRGVVRVENVENPHVYIPAVLQKTKPQHIERTYDVRGFRNSTEFLELLARKAGRLLKGGEADVDGVAKMVLNDFLRGKIPWFTPPPLLEGREVKEKGVEGRKGALGEMGRKRKAEDAFAEDGASGAVAESAAAEGVSGDAPGDLIDPVIAEPANAELIPENIPREGSDFKGFEEDEEGAASASVVDPDASSSDPGDDDGNESDVEEGGASLLEAEDMLSDGTDEENYGEQESELYEGTVLKAEDAGGSLPEDSSSRPTKRKRRS